MSAGFDGATTCLILGGARSGKTTRALEMAGALHRDQGLAPIYIATAQAHDAEMAERIALHQAERGPEWQTVEAPLNLPAVIAGQATPDRVLLVDCLTLWLTNLLFAECDLEMEVTALTAALHGAAGPVLVVSNEVGLSIVPENALARRFRDEQGRLNQSIAAIVDRVEFVAAGLTLTLKG